jgi:rsbT antagonist protein RsbS
VSETLPVMGVAGTLLVALRGDLDDAAALSIEERLAKEVARTHASGAVIDVSGLALVDSFIARVIARVAAMLRLLGCEVVVAGIQPAVAITLVELGVPMGHLHTALNAELGIELLDRLRRDVDRAG